MRLYFKCKCGLYNYTLEDWLAHFKHGKSIWRALVLLLLTEIKFKEE